jgi:hypothetical protein
VTGFRVSGFNHVLPLQGLKCMLGDFKVVNFFFLSFCMGIANGAIAYLFLYLDELGECMRNINLSDASRPAWLSLKSSVFSRPLSSRLTTTRR